MFTLAYSCTYIFTRGELRMSKSITYRVLLIALAVVAAISFMPFTAQYAHALTGSEVDAMIEALPSPEKVTLKDFTAVDKASSAMSKLDGDDNISDENFTKIIALAGALDEIQKNVNAFKLKGVKVKVGKKKATISWKKPTVKRVGLKYTYVVYQNGKKIGTTKSTKFVAKKLKKGKTYKFKVKAFVTLKYSDGTKEKVYTKASKVVKSKKIK